MIRLIEPLLRLDQFVTIGISSSIDMGWITKC